MVCSSCGVPRPCRSGTDRYRTRCWCFPDRGMKSFVGKPLLSENHSLPGSGDVPGSYTHTPIEDALLCRSFLSRPHNNRSSFPYRFRRISSKLENLRSRATIFHQTGIHSDHCLDADLLPTIPPEPPPEPVSLRNMLSILAVTAKPPTMFTEEKKMASIALATFADKRGPPSCSIPPITMMPEMAFVTEIRGV